jgi:hypothetical protein
MVSVRGPHQGVSAFAIFLMDIRPGREQHLNHLEVALPRSRYQWSATAREAGVDTLQIDIGSIGQEHLHYIDAAVPGC